LYGAGTPRGTAACIKAAGTRKFIIDGKTAGKVAEPDQFVLPNHQRRDVPERAERSAGIGGHNDIYARQRNKAGQPGPKRHHHSAHHERRREVIGDWGDEKSQCPSQPEQCSVAQS
jgi:hypothetical protein